MILRSHKLQARPSKDPNSSQKGAESSIVQTTPSPHREQLRVPLQSLVHNVTAQDDAATPSSKTPTIRQTRKLRDFLNDKAGCSPTNQTEIDQNSSPDCPYFSQLPKEDVTEPFSPGKFICTAQAESGYMKPWKTTIPCKTRSVPESTLVLDLEEVLVESSLLPQPDAQFTFLTPFQDTYYKIFVFTRAKKSYAENILEVLDPQKKLIRHRLYQEHCVCVSGRYVKDLNVLDRDLAKTVALDTLTYTLPFHLTNRVPVRRWSGNQSDNELLTLLPVLEQMTHMEDVRLYISEKF
ncbi:CTD small phosphatase-like protein 2-A isoform X2 [Dendrobates tinctorius]|uniref:CTD small phosphatase-like protein 2-A isoform X2 n=1 Tax=Dendrobates tinctorius TaxID=92724 RepID=UPI003CCA575A